ncbi:recombinase family protein [Streptomyces rectiviolaceus]|uniref:Recombinase family protein n=1 Tax=Streptomyces rectiviolaceus TaxID=332591 RepID=A0ABP6MVG8_9ACTN
MSGPDGGATLPGPGRSKDRPASREGTDMTHALTSVIDVAAQPLNGVRLRAVEYLRVSTEEQAKGYGIAYTGKKTTKYIADKGWEYIDRYADEGVSGSLQANEREDLKRLMTDARKQPRPFDVVVVHEERAIGRAGRAFWPWVWELEDPLGVFVAVVKGDYYNTTPEGRSRMRKAADYAEDEREKIRDRTQGGLQEKAESGGYVGGTVPYGWRIQDQGKKGESRLVLDIFEEDGFLKGEAITLRHARMLISDDGLDWTEAALRLNVEGMLNRSGRPWSRENLKSRLMSRAVLEGIQVYRDANSRDSRYGRGTVVDSEGNPVYGATVEIGLEPVFTEYQVKQLKRAAEKISTRRAPKSGKQVYPLSKRIDSLCGSYYVGRVQTSTGERTYVCSGKNEKYAGAETCKCSQIYAGQIEAAVWEKVTQLLRNTDELMRLAGEWVDMTLGFHDAHADRIESLDGEISVQQRAIATVMGTTATQAAQMGLDEKDAQQLVTQAVKPLGDELERLKALRGEAVAWQQETLAAEERARDLRALAEMARAEMPNMPLREQSDVVDLADIRVKIAGPVPVKRARAECAVGAWFMARGEQIPTGVCDARWALIEPLVKRTGRGSGKKTDLPLRQSVEAILWKARTAEGWAPAAARLERGVAKSLMSRWARWSEDGTWGRVVAALAGVETVPVPKPSNAVQLPDLEVSGAVDPRLLLEDSATHDQMDASRTTMSWQAAMTVRAIPGRPSRRAAPGCGS